MPKKYRELRARMRPAARAKAAARTEAMARELPLHELRAARDLSQHDLAQSLAIGQSSVSRLERRADIYISTLRNYVEALGGELEITARFPDGSVRIARLGKGRACVS